MSSLSVYCAHKRRYDSLAEAQRYIAWAEQQAQYDGRMLRAYQCPDCPYAHIWQLPKVAP